MLLWLLADLHGAEVRLGTSAHRRTVPRRAAQGGGTIRPGYPEDEGTLLSPVLKADQFYDFLGQAREFGAEILCGGQRVDVEGKPSESGLFFEPTWFGCRDSVTPASSPASGRRLLPVASAGGGEDIADADLADAMIDFLNENRYGLRNSVWTGSPELAQRFATEVTNAGQLKVNDSHIGFRSYLSSHGGTGLTGGPFGELNYVALRTSHLQGISWGNGEVRPIDRLVRAWFITRLIGGRARVVPARARPSGQPA